MTCRLALRILLLCLLQAELGCSIMTRDVPRPLNFRGRFALPDGRQSKFSGNLQGQLRKSFPQHQMQTSSFQADPAVNGGHGQKLSTSGKKQRGPTNTDRKDPAKQGAVRAQRDSFSFRQPYQSAALEPTSYGQKNSASLFGPVAPGPRSSIRMQTYAQGPARRVSPGRTKGAKARSLSSQTAVGKSYLSPELALNVGGHRPRSSRVVEAALGYAPVMVHEIPELFGGSAIRRLNEPSEQGKVPVQKQPQVSTPPRWVPPNNPSLTSFQAGSDWTRKKQNQGSVQKQQQVSTPRKKTDLPSIYPGSDWTRIKQNQGSVQKPQKIYTPPQRVPPKKTDLPSVYPGSDWTRIKQTQGSVQKPQKISTPPPRYVPAYNPEPLGFHPPSRWTKVKLPHRL